MSRLLAVVVCRALPVAVGAAAAVSCAQIAGIEDTSGDGRPGNSLALTRMSVGTQVTTSPLDLGGLRATYFVAGGDRTSIDRVDAVPDPTRGAWTTKLRAAAPVEFTLPDVPAPIPRLYTFPNPDLSVLYGVLEHPHPSPAPDGAVFAVTVPLDALPAMGETFQTYVVGAWLARTFAADEITVGSSQLLPPAYSFTAANSVPGRPQIDRVTADDAFLILRYLGAALTGVAESAPFEQTAAQTMVTTEPMLPVAPDRMLGVAVAPPALAARYAMVQPAVSGLALNWSLVAAPGYRIASNAGPVLHSGSLAATDVGIAVQYGNPFAARGWNTVLTLATSESRVYMPAGSAGTPTPITLNAGINQFIEPAEPTTPNASLDLAARLPTKVLFEGVALSSDGGTIKAPTSFVTVTFDSEAVGDAAAQTTTVYNLQVFDLVPNQMATALDRHLVLSAAGAQASFELPPEVFQVGHSYTLRALTTHGGYPTIAGGNFVNRELPLTQAYLDSGVFTVTP